MTRVNKIQQHFYSAVVNLNLNNLKYFRSLCIKSILTLANCVILSKCLKNIEDLIKIK